MLRKEIPYGWVEGRFLEVVALEEVENGNSGEEKKRDSRGRNHACREVDASGGRPLIWFG